MVFQQHLAVQMWEDHGALSHVSQFIGFKYLVELKPGIHV